MADSPSKRRRITPEPHATDENEMSTILTTPNRMKSYRSPTKSSLARSHPKLLIKSPGRSRTEPRSNSLRGDLLGKRSHAAFSEQSGPSTFSRRSSRSYPSNGSQQSRAGLDFATDITRAFTDASAGLNQSIGNGRIPLSPRQPRSLAGDMQSRPASDSSPTDYIRPKLVKASSDTRRATPRLSSDEPDLPPTPVQLGLDAVPYKPRGLASSSSGGSRNGSGKNRRRVREGGRSGITSSPLKPRHPAHGLQGGPSEVHDVERDSSNIVPEEAPESDVDENQAENSKIRRSLKRRDDQESDENGEQTQTPGTAEKQDTLAALQTELERLREDLMRLEVLTDDLSKKDDIDINDASLKFLIGTDSDASDKTQLARPDSTFDQSLPGYLHLFAPGSLRLTHSTLTSRVQSEPKISHTITVGPAPAWRNNSKRLSFEVQIDANRSCIDSVMRTKSDVSHHNSQLERWIQTRLQNPAHKNDIGGLVWGAGQYFDACMRRARTFVAVARSFDGQVFNERMEAVPIDSIPSDNDEAAGFFLEQNQIILRPNDTSNPRLEGILLTYDLQMTWTCNVETHIGISVSGVSSKAQKNAKELFARLLTIHGVAGAVDAVWNLLELGDTAESERSTAVGLRKRSNAVAI